MWKKWPEPWDEHDFSHFHVCAKDFFLHHIFPCFFLPLTHNALLTMQVLLRFSLCLLILFPFSAFAQTHQLSNAIPVTDQNGQPLPNAWAGGMSMPQFSAIELDGDGRPDLITYDRESNVFTPYLNKGQAGESRYEYAPQYRAAFDSCDCFGWALLADYNCDGRQDVFCGTPTSNVRVYIQQTQNDGHMAFELLHDPLMSLYSSLNRLYSGKIDFPSIVDVDYDGDLDYFTWHVLFNNIEFHKNKAMEYYGRCDTMVLELETACWGHFYESNFDNDVVLHDTVNCPLGDFDPNQRAAQRELRHAGSTTLLLHLNADSLYDALVGDISYPTVYALYNGGSLQYAYIDSAETNFPRSDVPVSVDIFPAAFQVDVNNDGKKDLLFAPNNSANGSFENTRGVALYLDQGNGIQPDFRFQYQGFLQNTHIEVGSQSVPTFLDYNQDGLQDILIGNSGYHVDYTDELIPALALYENTGTAAQPAFQLVDDDYLGLRESGQFFPLLNDMVPTVGDLDADGDEDLLIGSIFGHIYLFENVAAPGQAAQYHFITDTYAGIDVGFWAAPFLYDLDGDQDLDLIVGERGGKIYLYENEGTPATAEFQLVTDHWGFIEIEDEYGGSFSNGFPRPMLSDYDQDGEAELLVGAVTGYVEVYEGVATALTDTLQFAGNLFDFDFGERAAVAVAVLDSSQKPTFVVGNERGGLQLFAPVSANPTSVEAGPPAGLAFGLFPNPARDRLRIELLGHPPAQRVEVWISNVWGQQLQQWVFEGEFYELDLPSWPPGVYYVGVRAGNRMQVRPLIIQ